jgi:hypothetical protein
VKPIIHFNDGSPIALCSRCFIMTCYVAYEGDDKTARVISSKFDYDGNLCTSTPKGEAPPMYCDKCKNLLSYTLNE